MDHTVIDAYLREYEAAADAPSMLQIELPLAGGRKTFTREKSRIPGSWVLDTGMLTLHFEVGSTQAIHRDTAYVVVKDEPLKLVASWIALADVTPGQDRSWSTPPW